MTRSERRSRQRLHRNREQRDVAAVLGELEAHRQRLRQIHVVAEREGERARSAEHHVVETGSHRRGLAARSLHDLDSVSGADQHARIRQRLRHALHEHVLRSRRGSHLRTTEHDHVELTLRTVHALRAVVHPLLTRELVAQLVRRLLGTLLTEEGAHRQILVQRVERHRLRRCIRKRLRTQPDGDRGVSARRRHGHQLLHRQCVALVQERLVSSEVVAQLVQRVRGLLHRHRDVLAARNHLR